MSGISIWGLLIVLWGMVGICRSLRKIVCGAERHRLPMDNVVCGPLPLSAAFGGIYGQEQPIQIVADSLSIAESWARTYADRPLASFLFIGPPDAGQTAVAKGMADFVGASLERFDMRVYHRGYPVDLLLGTLPTQPRRSGELVRACRRSGPAVVLFFDDILQAHPRIMTSLIKMMDTGIYRDGSGQCVDLRRHGILVMTSRVSAEMAEQACHLPHHALQRSLSTRPEWIHGKCLDLLARIDTIVPFRPVSREVICDIVTERLEAALQIMRVQHGIRLRYDHAVVEELAAIVNDAGYEAVDIDDVIYAYLMPAVEKGLRARPRRWRSKEGQLVVRREDAVQGATL